MRWRYSQPCGCPLMCSEGAVWSRDGLQLRPFTNYKWYINGIISMGTVYSMGLSFHEWGDLLTYNWYFRPWLYLDGEPKSLVNVSYTSPVQRADSVLTACWQVSHLWSKYCALPFNVSSNSAAIGPPDNPCPDGDSSIFSQRLRHVETDRL